MTWQIWVVVIWMLFNLLVGCYAVGKGKAVEVKFSGIVFSMIFYGFILYTIGTLI